MLATQVLVCLPIGWVEVLEVLCMLATVVLVCLPIGWVEVLEVLCMLATVVLVCLPIGWVEVLEVLRMLDAQVLVYLLIGLKCWKFCRERCANTLYISTIFPSEKLAAQVLGVCIDWFEVFEVLRMLDAQVHVYLSIGLKCWKFCACWPHRYLCACLSVGLKCWKFCGCWMHRDLCTYRLG